MAGVVHTVGVDASLVLIIVAGALAALFAGVALLFLLLRRTDPERRVLAKRIGRLSLRNKGRLAVALMRDGRIPLGVRAVPVVVVLYLAMPLDLIPDFIPVIGHLDDLLIVSLGIGLLRRFAPREALLEHIERLEPARA